MPITVSSQAGSATITLSGEIDQACLSAQADGRSAPWRCKLTGEME